MPADTSRPAPASVPASIDDPDPRGRRLRTGLRWRPSLPADDPVIFTMDLRGLRGHWAARAALPAISAETMTGADRQAQALGYPRNG